MTKKKEETELNLEDLQNRLKVLEQEKSVRDNQFELLANAFDRVIERVSKLGANLGQEVRDIQELTIRRLRDLHEQGEEE